MISQVLFFLLRIALAIQGLLCFFCILPLGCTFVPCISTIQQANNWQKKRNIYNLLAPTTKRKIVYGIFGAQRIDLNDKHKILHNFSNFT
jgi:hypothetical protein